MKFRKYIFIYIIVILFFSCNKKKENNNVDVKMETNILSTDNLLKDVINIGNITLLDNLMNPQQLMNLDLDELRILRNTIYARYNYKFYSNDLRKHFSNFSWYNNNENYSVQYLTFIDHKNIKLIMDLENNFPLFIPYTDKRIYDFSLIYSKENVNKIIILGWSVDGKILIWQKNDIIIDIIIYDLKENEKLSTGSGHGFPDDDNYIGQKEWIDKIIKFAEIKYNILPIVDNIHTNIKGYKIYSKNILQKENWIKYKKNEWYLHFLEIGLKSNIDNNITIELRNINIINVCLTKKYDEPLTENDIIYYCIQNPFDENIIALIAIIPTYVDDDDFTGNRYSFFYEIIGIDMNNLK
jgi:hypothetical protein